MIDTLFATQDVAATSGLGTFDVIKVFAGPVLSACIAAVVAYVISIRTTNTQRRITIDGMLNKAMELAMQYPHLEREDYCKAWPPNLDANATKEQRDDKDRYDNYCCYLFNLIRQVWIFGGKKVTDGDDMLAFREYILRHKAWWKVEENNVHYYTQDFRNFVNGVIDEDARRVKAGS